MMFVNMSGLDISEAITLITNAVVYVFEAYNVAPAAAALAIFVIHGIPPVCVLIIPRRGLSWS